MRRLLPALCLLALALPAQAGLFDDDEARARVEKLRAELNAQVDKLVARLETATANQLEFTNQVESIKSELARLRGQVEVLGYELDNAQKRQKDFYVDLDSRLRKLETSAAAAAEVKPEPAKVDPASEMQEFEAALAFFKTTRYKESLAAFQTFIKNYPASPMAASAHYWAGSSLYQLRDYGPAAEMFGKLAAQWPNDAKAPDALLAQANAHAERGDAAAMRRSLQALVDKYPESAAAQTARPRLKKK